MPTAQENFEGSPSLLVVLIDFTHLVLMSGENGTRNTRPTPHGLRYGHRGWGLMGRRVKSITHKASTPAMKTLGLQAFGSLLLVTLAFGS